MNMNQPKLTILSEKQIKSIYQSSLEVLIHTGIKIKHPKIMQHLKKIGIRVENDLALIAPSFVEQALQSAPHIIPIYNRNGSLAMKLGKNNSYYGTGSDCPYILDSYTNQRRPFTIQDIEKTAVLCDALPNIDFIMSLGLVSGELTPIGDVMQFLAMTNNSIKPIVFTSLDPRGTDFIIQMASCIAGSKEKLREKPFLIHYIEPISPLVISSDAIDKLVFSANHNLPVVFTPGPMSGATSPVTLSGTLVTALAEIFAGLVISQSIQQGHGVVIGGTSGIMDMKTSITPYAGPEFLLLNGAMSEICHFLDLPMFGTAGCSDSKRFDSQAALEATSSIMIQTLCQANLIHDIGYLESGLTSSFDMLVLSDEIIAMMKQFMRGVRTEEDDLALDVIHEVGPGGHYLTSEHTLKYYREYWDPQLIDRQIYPKWVEKGSTDLAQRVNDRVKGIIETHKPPRLDLKILDILQKKINERNQR